MDADVCGQEAISDRRVFAIDHASALLSPLVEENNTALVEQINRQQQAGSKVRVESLVSLVEVIAHQQLAALPALKSGIWDMLPTLLQRHSQDSVANGHFDQPGSE